LYRTIIVFCQISTTASLQVARVSASPCGQALTWDMALSPDRLLACQALAELRMDPAHALTRLARMEDVQPLRSHLLCVHTLCALLPPASTQRSRTSLPDARKSSGRQNVRSCQHAGVWNSARMPACHSQCSAQPATAASTARYQPGEQGPSREDSPAAWRRFRPRHQRDPRSRLPAPSKRRADSR
jgi:hypothetical protein